MDEPALRHLVREVDAGRLSRRRFMGLMAGLGLPTSMAAAMVPSRRPALAATPGQLRIISWQGPTALNPFFSLGLKDLEACRIFYEPLLDRNADGELVPVLAAEVPSVETGDVSPDGLSARIRLKPNVVWHDGRPFTADDVIFNWEYASDRAAASSVPDFRNVQRMELLDARTLKVFFRQPTAAWDHPFRTLLIPRHVFGAYRGNRAREAPANLKPVGTGPYRCLAFQPGELLQAERNFKYHLTGQPVFSTLEVKGGGDAVSAARAVLQTGEFDYATNLQVEDDILKRLERQGKGTVRFAFGGTIEYMICNQTDPSVEVDGERSSVKTTHPVLTDVTVRRALSLLIDRAGIAEQIYGRAARPAGNFLNGPAMYDSRGVSWEFNPEKAAALLESHGWARGADGVRARGGRPLRLVLQTSANAPREKTAAIMKRAAERAGIALEIKSVPASVFFGSDPGNADTAAHFHADLQMYAAFRSTPDPTQLMESFVSWEVASKANRWQGANEARWRSDTYDRLFRRAEVELDPIKRAAIYIQMNDLLIQDAVVIPIVRRARVAASSRRLRRVELGPWGPELGNLGSWRYST